MAETDYGLALLRLIKQGVSEDDAKGQLADMVKGPGGFQALADAERREHDDAIRADMEREAALSPDARREAARAAREAAEGRKQDAADARLLLVAEGTMGEAEAAELNDDGALHAARIDVRPELMSPRERDAAAQHLLNSGKWRTMSEAERWQASRDLSDGGEGFVSAMNERAGVAAVTDGEGSEGGAE